MKKDIFPIYIIRFDIDRVSTKILFYTGKNQIKIVVKYRSEEESLSLLATTANEIDRLQELCCDKKVTISLLQSRRCFVQTDRRDYNNLLCSCLLKQI